MNELLNAENEERDAGTANDGVHILYCKQTCYHFCGSNFFPLCSHAQMQVSTFLLLYVLCYLPISDDDKNMKISMMQTE